MQRIVVPEILDHLDPAHPDAVRGRRDLALVDAWMGNSRWIVGRLAPPSAGGLIAELGAGGGALLKAIHARLPDRKLIGLDLAPRPAALPDGIQWVRGDLFETLPPIRPATCIGSLVLHHFPGAVLRELGRLLSDCSLLVFCEPHRSRIPLAMATLALPLAGRATRHDMPASIRAGFQKGELAASLGLDTGRWKITESTTIRGALRFVAERRD